MQARMSRMSRIRLTATGQAGLSAIKVSVPTPITSAGATFALSAPFNLKESDPHKRHFSRSVLSTAACIRTSCGVSVRCLRRRAATHHRRKEAHVDQC